MRSLYRLTLIATIAILAGCTPPADMNSFDPSKTTTITGTCNIEQVGWEISYTAKKTTLLLWMSGGDCEYD